MAPSLKLPLPFTAITVPCGIKSQDIHLLHQLQLLKPSYTKWSRYNKSISLTTPLPLHLYKDIGIKWRHYRWASSGRAFWPYTGQLIRGHLGTSLPSTHQDSLPLPHFHSPPSTPRQVKQTGRVLFATINNPHSHYSLNTDIILIQINHCNHRHYTHW